MVETFPWRHGCVKYGGNAMIDDDLNEPSPKTLCSCAWLDCGRLSCMAGARRSPRCLTGWVCESSFAAATGSPLNEAMDVVRMVLTGQVQREIVALINEHGPFAVGVSGEDAHLFTATQRTGRRRRRIDVDIGYVGDVVDVRTDFVTDLLDDGLIPVISSIGGRSMTTRSTT